MHCNRVSFVLVLIVATLALTANAQQGHFFTAPTYPVGATPEAVAVADLNGDGKIDLVTANYGDGTVSVLLGNGDGTFHPAVSYAAGINPVSIAVADFNGDGKPDLAVANYCADYSCGTGSGGTRKVQILLGNGDGTFQTAQPVVVPYNQSTIVAGDFNGDQKMDLAIVGTANQYANLPFLVVLLGNGDGTFQVQAKQYWVGIGATAVAADLNGDGKLDIVIGDGEAVVFLGNGDGTFNGVCYSCIGGFADAIGGPTVSVADFTGNGRPDLFVGPVYFDYSDYEDAVFLNNGNGIFQNGVYVPLGATTEPAISAAVTRNGNQDLISVVYNSINVTLGNGDGTFASPSTTYFLVNSDVSLIDFQNTPYLAAADLNGDGNMDIITANPGSNNISILLGNGDGTFQAANGFADGRVGENSLAVGDLNGDGNLDVVYTTDIMLGHGDGTLSAPLGSIGCGYACALADFNGDGKLDMVRTDDGDGASVYLGKGNGYFDNVIQYGSGHGTTFVVVADFNGDGKPDLALSNSADNDVAIGLGNGDGTFKPPVTYSTGFNPMGLATNDFNGDGKPDLAFVNNDSNNLSVLLGNGDGTFQVGNTYATGPSPLSLASADLRGNAKNDLVVVNYNGSSVGVLLGNGDGTFQAMVPYPVQFSPRSVTIADFNGDGKLDLAVGNTNPNSQAVANGSLSVLFGNGDGTFQPAVNYPGTTAAWIAAGDFNNDGAEDIAVADSMWISIFLNEAPGYRITISPRSATITAGQKAPFALTVAPLFGFSGTVSLSCSGLPTGASCSFNPASVPNGSGTSALTITTSASTTAGTYPVSVNGTSGLLKHNASLSLVVQVPPSFTISATAISPASVAPGGSATSTISISPTGGFNAGVTLSCSITLNGSATTTAPPSCSFNPSSVSNGSGNSTLTVSTTGSSAVHSPPLMPGSGRFYVVFLPLVGMALLGTGFASRRKNRLGLLLVCLILSGLIFLGACGGGGSGGGSTPEGTYTIKVSGTAGSTVNGATVTLIVQ